MSSDESRTTSSSRLSQFGLYRTIDARTEEFLRLSRKRQIRQGCACASVSTALTVTVVVVVLLFYEYNINPESKSNQRPIRKPTWFGLVNDSSPFDVKYNKAKLYIDPTTFKLLPIILKALNHNRYLRKFLEDSSTSPTFEQKEGTEVSYQTNVFPNRMRMPIPKMYTINNKSSKKNLDFYMRNRKSRDYQRVLNYFDKMIGDKVVGSIKADSIPPAKYYDQYMKPSLENSTDTITNHEQTTQHFEAEIPESQKRILGKYPKTCRCPKKLGILINKLISSIQELLPEIAISPCKYGEANNSTEYRIITTTKVKAEATHNTHNDTMSKLTPVTVKSTTSTKSIKHNSTNNKWYAAYKTNNFQTITTENVQLHKQDKSIKPYINVLEYSDFNNIKETINNKQTTTIKAYLESPGIDRYLIPSFTEAMLNANKVDSINQVTTKKINKLKDEITTTTQKPESQINTFKDDYNEFSAPTDTDTLNLEQIQKLIFPGKEIESRIYEENFDVTDAPYSSNIRDLNLFTLRKMGDLIIPSRKGNGNIEATTIAEKVTKKPETENKLTPQYYKIHKDIKENMPKHDKETKKPENITLDKDIEITTTELYNKTSMSDVDIEGNIIQNSSKLQHHRKTWEYDEGRFTNEDDIQDDEILHQVDNIIKTPIKYNKFESHQTNIDTRILNNVDHKESKPTYSKSMLPHSRPTYLEINRNNDWKQLDNLDYDTIANQNIVFN